MIEVSDEILIELKRLSGNANKVYLHLLFLRNKYSKSYAKNGNFFQSYISIGVDLNMDRKMVSKAASDLQGVCLINVEQKRAKKTWKIVTEFTIL